MDKESKEEFSVRAIYVVPNDREPWGDAKRRASEWLEDIQSFFACEMNRLRYGQKTFKIAKEENGELIFHQVIIPWRREDLVQDPLRYCKEEIQNLKLRRGKDIAVCFHESYLFTPGEICGKGACSTGGNAFLSSLHLKLAIREWISDDTEYEGRVFEWISPKPMESGILSWHGRGKKLGDVSGAAYGIMAHELGHCFGLRHDRSNDKNRRGNLMGNGCRGMRGYFRRGLTDDFCVLSEKSGALLNESPFFSVRQPEAKI